MAVTLTTLGMGMLQACVFPVVGSVSEILMWGRDWWRLWEGVSVLVHVPGDSFRDMPRACWGSVWQSCQGGWGRGWFPPVPNLPHLGKVPKMGKMDAQLIFSVDTKRG